MARFQSILEASTVVLLDAPGKCVSRVKLVWWRVKQAPRGRRQGRGVLTTANISWIDPLLEEQKLRALGRAHTPVGHTVLAMARMWPTQEMR
jgi:hypothetical protein